MLIIVIILLTDIMLYPALYLVFRKRRQLFFILLALSILSSLSTWLLMGDNIFSVKDADDPGGILNQMWFVWLIFFVWVPRFPVLLFFWLHYLIRKGDKGYRYSLRTGILVSLLFAVTGVAGNLAARNYISVKEVTIEVQGLHSDLDGLRIVQISDLHLSSFRHNRRGLAKAVRVINDLSPDLIVNTGDFVTIGANEFGNHWQELLNEKSILGKFAVRGNHDSGTYFNSSDSSFLDSNLREIDSLIRLSGYTVLNDTAVSLKVRDATLWLAGVTCTGRHPYVTHGDISTAISGISDSTALILLSHDPNSWDEVLSDHPNVNLTLSGHTHAMQAGVEIGGFRWSPSKYLYPRWYGHYLVGDQHLYVNRGLGTIGAPVRFGMNPEITLLILKRKESN